MPNVLFNTFQVGHGIMQVKMSMLTPYSVAYVAANKPLNSTFIEAVAVEEMPIQSGEIGDNETEYNTTGVDDEGKTYQSTSKMKQSVKAEWLPVGSSNRMTAPDVRRGEFVMLYKFADADKYYWNTLKNDLSYRKLETVVFAFSGTQDENAKPDGTNSYTFEVSTHKGFVAMRTSKANGEPFAYDLVLNTKEGRFSLTDDVGNVIGLHSTDTRIIARNIDDTLVDLNKQAITMYAPESIDLVTKRFSLVASESAKVETVSSILNAQTHVITAATTVSGTLTRTAGPSGDHAQLGGTLHVDGRISGDAEINVKKVEALVGTFSQSCTAPNIK
jgi:hypothetical protein